MQLLLPVVLAALAGQPGTNPQKLFLAMEEKLANARAVQITLEGKLVSQRDDTTAKGTVAFAPRGKLRIALDLDGKGFGQRKLLVVSDGAQFGYAEDDKKPGVRPTPAYFQNAVVTAASKFGVLGGMFLITRNEGDPDKGPFAKLQTTDFKLGKLEMINGRDAQAVEYKMTLPDQVKMEGVVWIDTQTTLPVKRQLVILRGEDRWTFTEQYSRFEVNAQLDAKTFELPK
jgi:outer membrane lipoprotein-sorting protein